MVGAHRGDSPTDRPGDLGQPHLGQVTVELSPSEQREMGAKEIANRWRALTGAIPGTEELTYTGEMRNFGDPIAIEGKYHTIWERQPGGTWMVSTWGMSLAATSMGP